MLTPSTFKALINVPYLAHFHTHHTDGQPSIEDYVHYCHENKINTLIFSEHVRKEMKFNFQEYVNEIQVATQKYPSVQAIPGAEAKILTNNDLDINATVLDLVDVVYIACHKFPNDIDLFEKVMRNQFANPSIQNKIKIWAHPGRFFKKYPNPEEGDVMSQLIQAAIKNDVYIEYNVRDQLLRPQYFDQVPKSHRIVGCDIHTHEQLQNAKVPYLGY